MVKDVMDGLAKARDDLSGSEGTALRCNMRCAGEADWWLAIARSQDSTRPMRREYGDAVLNRPNPPKTTSFAHPAIGRHQCPAVRVTGFMERRAITPA
jgi:hypothetical protein